MRFLTADRRPSTASASRRPSAPRAVNSWPGQPSCFVVASLGARCSCARLRSARCFPWLRDGEADTALVHRSAAEPGLACSPALVREARMLAAPVGHPIAHQESASLEDLERVELLRLPANVPDTLQRDCTPSATPTGRPIEHAPASATFNEILTRIGAGESCFTVGAQVQRYYVRPDVAYIPLRDAPPLEWSLYWRIDSATARVRVFCDSAFRLLGD
ncbi:LysR substrate-binding domain-containing protein [Streptomyces sp. NPDC055400]